MAVCLAMSKGRAANYGLLTISRKLCALSLSTNCLHRVRWVRSEINLTTSAGFLSIPAGRTLRLRLRIPMSAGIGMTAEMATRVMRDAVAISSRKAALEEIAARQERLRRFAGTETRTLLPPRSPATATPAPRTSSLPSSSAGPSAPVPLGWTQRPGGGSTGQVGFSMQTGDPAAGAPVKMQRALTRAPARDKRDLIAVESDPSYCE